MKEKCLDLNLVHDLVSTVVRDVVRVPILAQPDLDVTLGFGVCVCASGWS